MALPRCTHCGQLMPKLSKEELNELRMIRAGFGRTLPTHALKSYVRDRFADDSNPAFPMLTDCGYAALSAAEGEEGKP